MFDDAPIAKVATLFEEQGIKVDRPQLISVMGDWDDDDEGFAIAEWLNENTNGRNVSIEQLRDMTDILDFTYTLSVLEKCERVSDDVWFFYETDIFPH